MKWIRNMLNGYVNWKQEKYLDLETMFTSNVMFAEWVIHVKDRYREKSIWKSFFLKDHRRHFLPLADWNKYQKNGSFKSCQKIDGSRDKVWQPSRLCPLSAQFTTPKVFPSMRQSHQLYGTTNENQGVMIKDNDDDLVQLTSNDG